MDISLVVLDINGSMRFRHVRQTIPHNVNMQFYEDTCRHLCLYMHMPIYRHMYNYIYIIQCIHNFV